MPKPTEAMAEEARRGLAWREKFGRGGTGVGVARARDISNRRDLSDETVARMRSFFARHEVDKQAEGFSPGEEGYPSAGRIAWALWGGDPGQSWANARKEGKMQRKALQMHVKADDDGRIKGYASRFDEIDNGNDSVMKGAYSNSLRSGRRIKMLWQHDPNQPIGVWDDVKEDDTGLLVSGRILPEVEKGREALALVKAGAVDGLSIGYRTIDSEPGANGERRLKEWDLWEVSLVTFPMQETARVDAVKAADMSRREMETLLTQDAGLSRTVARALMDGGMGAVKATQDAGENGLGELAQFMRETMEKGINP